MLTLYNTLTRRKEPFRPIDAANVRMYVCGPTVYDFAHIGNARPVIVFDVLFRLLRHLATKGEWDGGRGETIVTYARNITDVDDKINARAVERYPELPPTEAIAKLTAETTAQFHTDIAALGVLPPTVEPRATQSIAEMRALIESLVANGHAYVAESHVLFDVPTMPDYGRLANRSLEEMEAGARVDVAPYKKGPMDFVLWKPSKPGEPAWPSPAGIAVPGRPGWHIECSAMADRWLWQEAKATLSPAGLAQPHVFDIHGGGIDLVFPHHENEVAQSRCGYDTPKMANYWMHNGFLQVEGEKMSKSLGNFVTIRELLREWPGEIIRYQMLMTQYRQPIDWTDESGRRASLALIKFGRMLKSWRKTSGVVHEPFIGALQDDLNTPAALASLHELYDEIMKASIRGEADLNQQRRLDALLNAFALLGFDEIGGIESRLVEFKMLRAPIDEEKIATLLEGRNAARKAKNFKEADRIRDELTAMGIQLKDAKDPATGEIVTTWEVRASAATEVKR